MRADKDSWLSWISSPLNLVSMGVAVTTGKLKFATGDYASMIKNPKMAGPFVKSFKLMSEIGGE